MSNEELNGSENLATMSGKPKLTTNFVDQDSLTTETLQQLTNLELRDYQVEMARAALQSHSLICLPTGAGKTLIAAAVVHAMLRVNPQKMAVFVVNTVALVEQQAKQLQQQIPHIKVVTAHGQMEDTARQRSTAKVRLKADVLIITCQVLNNYLTEEAVLRMCDICCLVLDEAHHAIGRSPYATLMTRHYASVLCPDEYRPLVICMSASPVDSNEGIKDFEKFQHRLFELKRTLLCRLCTPKDSDVYEHIPRPKTSYTLAGTSHKEKDLKNDVDAYLRTVMQKVDGMSDEPIFGEVTITDSNKMRGICRIRRRKFKERCDQNISADQRDICTRMQLLLRHVQAVLQAHDINFVVGWAAAAKYLKDVFEEIEEGRGSGMAEQRVLRELLHWDFNTLHKKLIREAPVTEYSENTVSERCQHLVGILKMFIDEEDGGRAIVFVSMRKTAQKLKTFLDMTQMKIKQEQVLNSFRRGTTRLLIATNVLEEGIDVPKCSLVVRFDTDVFLRSLIQSRGRARAEGGRFVLICSSEEQVSQVKSVMQVEKFMMLSLKNEMDNPSARDIVGRLPEACERRELEVDPSTGPRGEVPPEELPQDGETDEFPQWAADDDGVDGIWDEDWAKLYTGGDAPDSEEEYAFGDDGLDFDEQSVPVTAVFTKAQSHPEEVMWHRLDGICDVKDWQRVTLPVRDILCVTEHYEFVVNPPINASYADDRKLFERVLLQSFFSAEFDDMWLQVRKNPHLTAHALRLEVAKLTLGSWFDHHEFIGRTDVGKTLRLSLDYSEREITIAVDEMYLLEFNFWEVQDFLVVHASTDLACVVLHITLRHPPRLYQRLEAEGTNAETKNRLVKIEDANHNLVDADTFAACLVYRLELANPEAMESVFTPNITKCLRMFHAVGKVVYFAHVTEVLSKVKLQTQESGLPEWSRHANDAEVNYAWRCVCSSPGFVVDRYRKSFFEELDAVHSAVASESLYRMAHDLGRSLFGEPSYHFRAAKKAFLKSTVLDGHIGDSHAKVRRMILTPTRMVFFEPDIMQTNRVLRKFKSDKFIRISIRDDNLDKLSTIKGEISALIARVAKVMKAGFSIGNTTKYMYLAGSNSQTREHACWFLEESETTADYIRTWIGDLQDIRNVASYTSRLGLGFSTSKKTVSVPKELFVVEEDVRHKEYNFTDGIGRLTMALADKISSTLKKGFTPSAYQVRFGGSKGVLVVDKNLHLDHPGKELVLRKSMHKYPSIHTDIEVLDTSRPIRLSLNQQIIMLLSNMGISDSVFLHLLKTHLAHMSEMFIDEKLARQKLTSISSVDSRRLEEADVHITSEPYLRSLLMALYRCQMKDLLEKSKVPIDDSKARVLIGIADDTRTLEYGQVFVQYSTDFSDEASMNLSNQAKSTIRKGTVVIAKNPCLHPGDVRRFEAVDRPQLHHLYDCVVFPCKGERPHPNELSGSDLDGDLYHVIWDDSLIPTEPNKKPMDYTATPKTELQREIKIEDVIEHIGQYIEHDTLGIIDTMHLALADLNGIECEDCLTLAVQHSKAVDAPKSGDWQTVDRDIQEKVKRYPDFMMKTRKPSYPSDKVLGKMFRECNKYMNITRPGSWWGSDSGVELHEGFYKKGFEEFEEDARTLRKEYNNSLHRAMKMYGVRTEGEFMSGYIEKLHEKVHDKEVEDVRETIKLIRQKLIKNFRNRFEENVGTDEEKRLQKASAWYFVTYGSDPGLCVETYDPEENPWHRGERRAKDERLAPKRFLSFPWIVGDLLAKIYVNNMKVNPQVSMQSIATIVGKSTLHEFKRCTRGLVRSWKERHTIWRSIRKCLRPLGRTFMTGLSAAMLFEEEGVLGFAIMPKHEGDRAQVETKLQLQKRIIEGAKELMHNMLERSERPACEPKYEMLLCKFRKGSMPGSAASRTWCEFTTRISDLKKWSALVMYIKAQPHLLPLLRLLVGWMRSTDLTDPSRNLVDQYTVPFMVLNLCLEKGYIHAVDTSEVVELYERAPYDNKVDLFTKLVEWESAIRRACIGQKENQLGDLLLEFFRHGHAHIHSPINSQFLGILFDEGEPTFADLMKGKDSKGNRAADLLLEEIDRAFHRLSLHASASVLLKAEMVEKLFFIDSKAAYTILGRELDFGRFLRKRSGVMDVEVFPKPGARAPGLLIRALGTAAALWAVERIVKQLSDQYKNEEKNTALYSRAVSAVDGAYCYLMEGADGQDDRIVLEDYYRPCHPHHDNASKFVVRICRARDTILPPGSLDPNFTTFLEHFRTQLGRMSRYYSPQMHGECDMRIKFGKSYIRNPPKEFSGEKNITVSALLSALEKKKRTVDPAWLEAAYVRRPSTRRHVETRESKYSDGRGSASFSFFSTVDQKAVDNLVAWMRRNNLVDLGQAEVKYGLLVTRDGNENMVYYNDQLQLLHVRDPDFRWSVVDMKRAFQSQPRASASTNGIECDIRFILRTHFPPDDSTPQAAASGLHRALSREGDGRRGMGVEEGMPCVDDKLMKAGEALLLKKEKRMVFENREAEGVLSQVQVELTEYKTQSRPARGKFTESNGYLDLQLRLPVENLRSGDSTRAGKFLEDIWRLAFELSDVVQSDSS
ncbi:unnamed protein product [Ostreobium quekettii]|uniref:RNA-directed RNA polymerase n=1 Tax=Ostreobium quekettii TaxID=121088 RepID=A0A8S1IKZ0_9CHLO|nr:unnamed protein product [Ostreobium quekettii]